MNGGYVVSETPDVVCFTGYRTLSTGQHGFDRKNP